MPLSLPSLPEDIFFEIVIRIGITDVISLFETCASLRVCFSSRSLWIVVLNHARESGARPLPCPPKQDFTKLDLLSLQQIGLVARRLEQNLDLPRPRPVSPIQTINLNSCETLFAVIPGTKLIITYNMRRWKLYCWDIAAAPLARRVCWLGVKLRSKPNPSYFMEDGKCVFAVEVDMGKVGRSICAICVDFHDRNAIMMRVIFKSTVLPIECIGRTFIDEHIIGVLVRDNHDPYILLCMVFNMKSHRSVTFTTKTLFEGVECCSLFRQNLYIFVEGNDRKVHIYHIPPEHLPYSHTHNSDKIQMGDPLDFDDARPNGVHDLVQGEQAAWYNPLQSSAVTPWGNLHVVTTGHYGSHSPTRKITVSFWPVEVVLHRDHIHSPLTFSPIGYDYTIKVDPIGFSVYTTGMHVVVCVRKGKRGAWKYSPRLLRFVNDPVSRVIVSDLDVPHGTVDLSALKCLALDDHLGLVFLVDHSKRLFCIAYA